MSEREQNESLYPVYLDMAGRRVVVIGGGPVAERKVDGLLAAGAAVAVVSPEATVELERLAGAGRIELARRRYERGDLAGAWLAVCACGEREADEAVAAEAGERGIWCNVVDVPELCTFQVPAVMRRGPLQVAISTGGVSPALAGRLRRELEERYGPAWERYLEAMRELREWVKGRWPGDDRKRGEVLKAFVAGEGWRLLEAGDEEGFGRLLAEFKMKNEQ